MTGPTGETPRPDPAAPRLREARFADFAAVHELESVFFDDSFRPADRERLFTDSPLWPRLRDRWPVGWVLEDDAGRLVGSLTNVPSAYLLDGQERLCANGHCWAVLPEHRGYAITLMDEYFAQARPDLLISAKVGADATPVWGAYARRVPVGDWSRAAYRIARYPEFARAALERVGVPLAAVAAPVVGAVLRVVDALRAPALPAPPPSVEVGETRSFDERFDAFWAELVEQNPKTLLGVRDAATLRWRFGVPLRENRAWVLTASRGGRLVAYAVLKEHLRTGGLRSMKLVDFQSVAPEDDLLPGLLRPALARAAAQGCAMLEHHGCGLSGTRAFDDLAPRRATKPAWSFYYAALDPDLDARLADPAVWQPSEYDGDSGFK